MTAARATLAQRKPVKAIRPGDAAAQDPEAPQLRLYQRCHERLRGWRARASTRARQAIVVRLDASIAALQRLRECCGRTEAEDDREGDRQRARTRRGGASGGSASASARTLAPAPAPAGKARRRSVLLVSLVLMLGMFGGTALSYELLGALLERRDAELERVKLKLAKNLKSMGRLERQAENAKQRQERAEAQLAQRTEENAKKLEELDARRSALEARLQTALARETAVPAAAYAPARSQPRGERGARTLSGECTLGGDNVRSALKGCMGGAGPN